MNWFKFDFDRCQFQKDFKTEESLDLLRLVDVDLEKEETYEKAFDYYRDNLRKLEELLNS